MFKQHNEEDHSIHQLLRFFFSKIIIFLFFIALKKVVEFRSVYVGYLDP